MKPKLTYFDAPVSRGEECRLALWLANVDFDDHRVKGADFPAVKAKTPFGSVPTFEIPGKPVIAQSNAILVYIGREHGLHPKDNFEAARHEAMMGHIEDVRTVIGATLRLKDDEKKRAREDIAANVLPEWAARAESFMTDGPLFAGATPHVVDTKIFMIVRWLTGGKIDHIPTTIVSACPKLMRAHDAFRDLPRVQAWYARA
jgi:glutathione S-transferase